MASVLQSSDQSSLMIGDLSYEQPCTGEQETDRTSPHHGLRERLDGDADDLAARPCGFRYAIEEIEKDASEKEDASKKNRQAEGKHTSSAKCVAKKTKLMREGLNCNQCARHREDGEHDEICEGVTHEELNPQIEVGPGKGKEPPGRHGSVRGNWSGAGLVTQRFCSEGNECFGRL